MDRELAARIDHTALSAETSEADVRRLCDEARELGFASVCVNSRWIPLVAELLEGSESVPCAVVGFPLGAMSSAAKAFETVWAVEHGAAEVDMVIDGAAAQSGDRQALEADVAAVVDAAGAGAEEGAPALVKVIIEACLLTDEQKVMACEAAVSAGADFVKTSTGFSTGGATVHDVELMRRTVGPEIGVKASGGIRSRADALAMIEAGASRIGASKGIEIVRD